MMLGGKKDGGMAQHIFSKMQGKGVMNAPTHREDKIGPKHKEGEEQERDITHADGMHSSMQDFHDAFHAGDVKRMAKAFASAHVLAEKYHEDMGEDDKEKEDDAAINMGYQPYE